MENLYMQCLDVHSYQDKPITDSDFLQMACYCIHQPVRTSCISQVFRAISQQMLAG